MGTTLTDRVTSAVASVDDPELPGVSVVDLGLLERLEVDEASGRVSIGLVPTFSGCPALAAIRADVGSAVSAVAGVARVEVEFLAAPVWTIERVTDTGRTKLADALGVAVAVAGVAGFGADPVVPCPRCAAPTRQESLFGPTRCRAVHRCTGCHEVVEVMR